MMVEMCYCCTPGWPGKQLCRSCFMVWYDSGITIPADLAREVRWRYAHRFWPWGKKSPTLEQLEAMMELPLPNIEEEMMTGLTENEYAAAYTRSIFDRAEAARVKAQAKFPQPNYVALKVAEEAGEVVRGAVHYAENRATWEELEGEVIQTIAMCLRLLVEGDQVNGVIPPRLKADKDPA